MLVTLRHTGRSIYMTRLALSSSSSSSSSSFSSLGRVLTYRFAPAALHAFGAGM
jgi:hypothetical protein